MSAEAAKVKVYCGKSVVKVTHWAVIAVSISAANVVSMVPAKAATVVQLAARIGMVTWVVWVKAYASVVVVREERAAPSKVTVLVPPVSPSPKTVAARIAYAPRNFMIVID